MRGLSTACSGMRVSTAWPHGCPSPEPHATLPRRCLRPHHQTHAHRLEAQGKETLAHHKQRAHPRPGETDTELLKDEGADLPHSTKAGRVNLPGAAK